MPNFSVEQCYCTKEQVGKSNTIFIEAADVNDDGDVDIADAVKIVNYVVGKVSALSRPVRPSEN